MDSPQPHSGPAGLRSRPVQRQGRRGGQIQPDDDLVALVGCRSRSLPLVTVHDGREPDVLGPAEDPAVGL